MQPTDSYGERIYAGTVTSQFRYERWVRDNGDGTRTATHLTWHGDEAVVLQQARQDERGRLISFDEIHGQRGDAQHVEQLDVVVGPTLFEFVRANLDALRAGKKVPFVFWSQGSSYDFALTLSGDVVEMRAESPFVRLAVATIRLRIGAGDHVIEYHGRVPPLLDGREFDADVTYEYFTPFR